MNQINLAIHTFLTLNYPKNYNLNFYLENLKNIFKINDLTYVIVNKKDVLTLKDFNYPNDINCVIILNENWNPEEFENILEITKKYNYVNMVINFNFSKWYFLEQNCELEDIVKFKSNLRFSTKNIFSYITNLSEPNLFPLNIEKIEFYKRTILNTDKKLLVIGDIHERVEELKLLLEKVWIEIKKDVITKNTLEIILLWDIIDKWDNTKEILEFIYENRNHFKIIRGNHESYVEKKLNNKLEGKASMTEEEELFKFSSLKTLLNNEDLKNKFLELSKDFYPFIKIPQHNLVLTHAPCPEEYINKTDTNSLKKQRNYRPNGEDKYNDNSNFEDYLKELMKSNKEYKHIFWHISLKSPFEFKNQLNLDTGCVYGNFLTGALIEKNKDLELFYQNSLIDSEEKRKLLDTTNINFNL